MADQVQTSTQLLARLGTNGYTPEKTFYAPQNLVPPQVARDLIYSWQRVDIQGVNGCYIANNVATTTLTALSGATATATNLIPAGAIVQAIAVRTTVLITGATSYNVGDGTTANLYGATIGVAVGSTNTFANYLSTFAPKLYTTATSVVLTAVGSNFTAGSVEIAVLYQTLSPLTS